MPFSIVEAVRPQDGRRPCAPPLANYTARQVSSSQFSLVERETTTTLASGDVVTSEIALYIRISAPAGGFAPEGNLPDPALRLHAVSDGWVRFEPGSDSLSDRLILTLNTLPFRQARWWQRWVEAECEPWQVVYESVDRAALRRLLAQIPIAQQTSNHLPQFPRRVTDRDRADFIEAFLAGIDPEAQLLVRGGDVVGAAALETDSLGLLQLRAYYNGHTPETPHPLRPTEFLYLLFGEDSEEARVHPLLRRINETGTTQTEQPETRRMRMRPPLRTYGRVLWEALQEIEQHRYCWAPKPDHARGADSGRLGPDRFFNSVHYRARNNRGAPTRQTFGSITYEGFNKCNLFVSDICLRAGFRVGIHSTGNTVWHYLDANGYTHAAQNSPDAVEMYRGSPIMGREEDQSRILGFCVDRWLGCEAGWSADKKDDWLNEVMHEEGRCIILAGAKGRKNSSRKRGIGHIVIATTILAEPKLIRKTVKSLKDGTIIDEGAQIQRISLDTVQASGTGAIRRTYRERRDSDPADVYPPTGIGGRGGSADSAGGFIRMHLIELHPGRDPGTLQGLRDLNVNVPMKNLLGTIDEEPPPEKKSQPS